MKNLNKIIACAVAATAVTAANDAMAAYRFGIGDLARVIYSDTHPNAYFTDADDYEFGYKLLDFTDPNYIRSLKNYVTGGLLPGTTDSNNDGQVNLLDIYHAAGVRADGPNGPNTAPITWGNLVLGYYNNTSSPSHTDPIFLGSADAQDLSIITRRGNQFDTFTTRVSDNYNHANVWGGLTSQYNSYVEWGKGTYGEILFSTENPLRNLGTMAANGYVDMYLFYFPNGNVRDTAHLPVATLRLLPNGQTIINPQAAPVPVPASALIFGSGILGLFGLRRRS